MQTHLLQGSCMQESSHPTLFLICPAKDPVSYSPCEQTFCGIPPTPTCKSRKRRRTSSLPCFPGGLSLAHSAISAECRMMPESVAQTTCGHFCANLDPFKPVSLSLRPVELSLCVASGLTVQSGAACSPCLPFLAGMGMEAVPAFGS